MKTRWRWVAVGLLAVSTLAYLRDPAWLIGVESGFGDWETDGTGQRFHWMEKRGSFFVSSDAGAVTIPLRALFPASDRRPFVIRVDVNDRPTTQAVLADEEWTTVTFRLVLPRGWSRKVARVDLHADRTWSDRAVSVQVGEGLIEK